MFKPGLFIFWRWIYWIVFNIPSLSDILILIHNLDSIQLSHTFFQKVTLKEKITPLDWPATGLFLLDQEPTLGGGAAGVHGRPRS